MKRKYFVEIHMEIEGPEMNNFDPVNYNYEWIHNNDDTIRRMVEDAFQMTLPQYSIDLTAVVCRDTKLELNSVEQTKSNEYYDEEVKKDADEYIALHKLGKEHGITKAIWSVSNITSELIGTERFGKKVRFVYDMCGTEAFSSNTYENPTYLDAWKEFDKAIKHTGDFHHVFLESFVELQVRDGITSIGFSTGS